MGNILKITAKWDGFQGAPGYSNFYWREDDPAGSFDQGAQAAAVAVEKFFNDIKLYFPPHVKWRVQTDAAIIDENTGTMVDIASAGAHGDIIGTAGNFSYSAATGAVVSWRSNGVRNGRRVRGRTFLVPTAATALAQDGTLDNTASSVLFTAAQNYINTAGARSPVVWARPTTPTATDGIAHDIVTASVPDKVAVLKSRRD